MKCDCPPRMNHKLRIETSSESQDAYGATTKTWSTFAGVFGEITPATGYERSIVNTTEAQVTHKIRIRWMAGITPKMRVVYDSRTFNITSVINDREQSREIHLMCQEVI